MNNEEVVKVDIRECHLSLSNPEDSVFCHEGLVGNMSKPYEHRKGIYCSAWNKDHKVCNLTLQPTVVVNVSESSRHNCDCDCE